VTGSEKQQKLANWQIIWQICLSPWPCELVRDLLSGQAAARASSTPTIERWCRPGNLGNLRYHEPGFVAVTTDGAHCLIETKGLEDVNVAFKDRAAHLWCENVTVLTGTPGRT